MSSILSKTVARSFSSSSPAARAAIQEVVVIGGGLMGAGIAQVAAQTGHNVTLVDISKEVLDKSEKRIGESIKRVAKKSFKDDAAAADKFVSESTSRLSVATKADEALKTADLVVEAVVENMELKQKLFKVLSLAAIHNLPFILPFSFFCRSLTLLHPRKPSSPPTLRLCP